jgi:hypothetical protein
MRGATSLGPDDGHGRDGKEEGKGATRGTHRVRESETVMSLAGEKTAAFQRIGGKREARMLGSHGLLPVADAVIEAEDCTTRSGGI